LGSAFFSGLEAALFAVPESRAHVYKVKKKKGGKALVDLKHNLTPAITLIVVGNNIFNIVGSMLVGVFAARAFGDTGLGIASAVVTILVILFGEIIPKTIGENNADEIALFFAQPLHLALVVFGPVIWLLIKLTNLLRKERPKMTEEELAVLSSISHEEGSIEEDEHEMIQRVFKLNDLTAEEIMTPKNEIIAYQESVELGHLEDKIYELPHSRIPLYGEDIDHVTGIVNRWELLTALGQNRQRTTVGEISSPPFFVKNNMKADVLLPLFQKTKRHMAIVRNDQNETLGVVTLEDVLEELVGNIRDETDDE
jgi:CBS domain containing-hemolysin-like protein